MGQIIKDTSISKLIENNRRMKKYTVPSLVAIFVIILLVFVIIPLINGIVSDQSIYNTLVSNEGILSSNLNNLFTAESLYNSQIVGNSGVLETALPNTLDSGVLFANMNAIAIQDTVSINSIAFSTTSPSESVSVVPISPLLGKLYFNFSAVGNLVSVENYLNNLEAFPRTINIDSVSLSMPSAKASSSTVYFTINGYVYYLKV